MRSTRLLLALSALMAISAQAAEGDLRSGFGLHAGAHIGLGQMGGTSSVSRHTEGTFNLEAMPGWRFRHDLMVGVLVDFRAISQLDDASKSGDTDYSGHSALFGVGALYEPGRIKLLASYDPIDRHWIAGNGIVYRGSGFHALVGYKFETNWSADLEFAQASYDSVSFDGVKSGLGDTGLHHWNLGLGVSLSY